jgi:hypothetical protein
MQFLLTILLTVLVGAWSWNLPNFWWRISIVTLGAFAAANLFYLFAIWLYPDSELSNWAGLVINLQFKIAAIVGLYIVLVIQAIKWRVRKRAI